MEPEKFHFKDDGKIPNNKLPTLLYKKAFNVRGDAGAEWVENRFAENNWRNSWGNGIFNYHHYHSITHEVLGVYSGTVQPFCTWEGNKGKGRGERRRHYNNPCRCGA